MDVHVEEQVTEHEDRYNDPTYRLVINGEVEVEGLAFDINKRLTEMQQELDSMRIKSPRYILMWTDQHGKVQTAEFSTRGNSEAYAEFLESMECTNITRSWA